MGNLFLFDETRVGVFCNNRKVGELFITIGLFELVAFVIKPIGFTSSVSII